MSSRRHKAPVVSQCYFLACHRTSALGCKLKSERVYHVPTGCIREIQRLRKLIGNNEKQQYSITYHVTDWVYFITLLQVLLYNIKNMAYQHLSRSEHDPKRWPQSSWTLQCYNIQIFWTWRMYTNVICSTISKTQNAVF